MFGSRRGKTRAGLAVASLITALLVSTAPAGAQAASDEAANDYLIVTLTGSPAAHDDATKTAGRFDPTSQGYQRALDRMQRQHARFIERLGTAAPGAVVVDEFFVTANAVVIKLNGANPSKITAISGVERTQSSTLYRMDMNESVDLINVDDYWDNAVARADAGDGVKVGVIDSGIDGTHPFFACKDEVHFGGIYFSGQGILPQVPSASAIFGPGYSPLPGDPLYFSSEHGTHVAGTIGGCVTTINFPLPSSVPAITLSGVAPGVELWDYNVFPFIGAGMVAFEGSAFSHDIGEAIEDAVLDGMDVINMSLSGGTQGPHDFLAEVANAAADAGVVVVAATGNDDPGLYMAGSPATGSEVIGVGATTNAHKLSAEVVTPADTYEAAVGEFADFDGSILPLAAWSGTDYQACSTDGAVDHSGEVVLISRGSCSFSQKVFNAESMGALGVIIYNNVAGDPIPMAVTAGFGETIPAVMVSDVDGAAILAEPPTTVAVSPRQLGSAVPNLLADFSNIGPAAFTHIIKPDVVAPGENVLSSVFTFDILGVTGHGWDLFNGTSMATPHVSGAAAILVAEGRDNREVKSALVTTAFDLGYEVWEQGGGLIDVFAAFQAESFFYPSSASFGVFKGNAPANGAVEIDISGAACQTATVPAGEYVSADITGSTLTVEFAGGRDAATDFYSGVVTVTCGGDVYHLPFLAVVNR